MPARSATKPPPRPPTRQVARLSAYPLWPPKCSRLPPSKKSRGSMLAAPRASTIQPSGRDWSLLSATWIRPRAATVVAKSDRKSTRLNSSHLVISYAVFCLKKKNKKQIDYMVSRCTEERVDVLYALVLQLDAAVAGFTTVVL